MTYMRIYWKRKPDSLKKLIERYAGNKDVQEIGANGWEILVNSKEIVKEIKKYCQYRNKNVTIDKIEEIDEEEINNGMDEIDEMEEIYVTDEWHNKLEEEIDEADELENEIGQYMEIKISTIISQWQDFYSELPSEETLMDLYQQPEFRCSCNPVDGCDCEENYMHRKMIENSILEGKYHPIYYSKKRIEMEKMKDKYY
jgi:hypothetical protein